jgi:hypothetical protein
MITASERRALLVSPLAATAAFLALPVGVALIAATLHGRPEIALAFIVMASMTFGILALAGAYVTTIALFFGARFAGRPLSALSRNALLGVGLVAGAALTAIGRVWLSDEVGWGHLWLALPAGLVGARVFERASRPRE